MAEATRYSNVIIPTTGQTITGPLSITAIKVIGGASGATVNISNATSTIIFKSVVAANTTELTHFSVPWEIRSEAYTVNVTAGGADIYIYLE
jgi:hypothetical protein